MRRRISTLLIIIMCFLSLSSPVLAQGYQREITGEFSNIEVKVNDLPLSLYREPFIYEGEVYLPLKNLAAQMGFNIEYDEKNLAIDITNNVSSQEDDTNLDLEIFKLHQEIFAISKSIEELGGRSIKPLDDLYDNVPTAQEMISYLRKYYGILEGVPLSLDFRSPDDHKYLLYVYIPQKYRGDFEKISHKNIEYWLEDIYFAIREHFDFVADLSGLIKDEAGTDKTYVVFDGVNGKLNADFREGMDGKPIDINKRDLQEHLHDKLSSYNNVEFKYVVTPNRYDIDLKVYFDDNKFYSWSTSRQKDFLDKLRREIKSYKNGIYVYGSLIDDNNDERVSYFVLYEDNAEFRETVPRNPLPTRKNKEDDVNKNSNINTVTKRNINTWVSQPELIANKKAFPMLKNLFIIDEEIYIALSDLGDALHWAFDYDKDNSVVSIISGNMSQGSTSALKSKLFADAHGEKERLLQMLEETREDVEKRESLLIPYEIIRTVGRMESYLKEYFEDFEGINTSISFSDSGKNHYRLKITYPSNDYNKFKNIRRNIIEGWIEEIFDTVKELYNPYATISGSIRTRPFDDDFTNITFDVEERRLVFDFEDHENEYNSNKNIDVDDLERSLDKRLWRFAGVPFRYEAIKNRRDVDLNIYFNHNRFYDWDIFEKMDYLEELYEEVQDVYDFLKINGRIMDQHRNETVFSFSFVNNKILSFDLLQDLEKYLNQNYNKFSNNAESLYFTYTIHEKSNSFDIIMEGDFFKEENSWRGIESDDEFKNFVSDVKGFVEDFWDIDVKVEVVDKAYSSLIIK